MDAAFFHGCRSVIRVPRAGTSCQRTATTAAVAAAVVAPSIKARTMTRTAEEKGKRAMEEEGTGQLRRRRLSRTTISRRGLRRDEHHDAAVVVVVVVVGEMKGVKEAVRQGGEGMGPGPGPGRELRKDRLARHKCARNKSLCVRSVAPLCC